LQAETIELFQELRNRINKAGFTQLISYVKDYAEQGLPCMVNMLDLRLALQEDKQDSFSLSLLRKYISKLFNVRFVKDTNRSYIILPKRRNANND